jgi:hypothetical protein
VQPSLQKRRRTVNGVSPKQNHSDPGLNKGCGAHIYFLHLDSRSELSILATVQNTSCRFRYIILVFLSLKVAFKIVMQVVEE